MLIRGKVPLRVSFAGGGTDVAPYCDDHGGVVLSSTINLYAYATIEERMDDQVVIQSLDYDTVIKYDVKDKLRYDGRLDLLRAIIFQMSVNYGLNLFIHNDAPPGSGLGSSGSIATMIVGMVAEMTRRRMTKEEIASTAIQIEREVLKIPGGKQDQYAAAFGGFNFIEFYKDRTIVNPLRIDSAIVRELEYHLMLVYTKKTHYSGDLIQTQVDLYKSKDGDHLQGLHELKAITYKVKEALLTGEINRFGDLLHQAWLSKRKMNALVTTPEIEALYEEARKLGVRGGKILGAGGGGYILLFCPFNRKHLIARKVEEMGAKVVPFSFEEHGLQTWRVKKSSVLPSDEKSILEQEPS